MNITELKNNLDQVHESIIQTVDQLSTQDFEAKPMEKWSAGEHLEHIKKSVAAVRNGFGMPKATLKNMFGEPKGDARSFDEIVEFYKNKLASSPLPVNPFAPKAIDFSNKSELFGKVRANVQSLNEYLDKCSEEELDTHQLPHPLLGNLTLREMLYFTINHVKHHEYYLVYNLEQAASN